MKTLLTSFVLLLLTSFASAQNSEAVDTATANAVIQKCAQTFPKFYREFQYIKANDELIKQVILIKGGPDRGPAFASPNGVIRIDLRYLETQRPDFDDNRLIVVLYHEIGHLHYFVTVPRGKWTPDNNEQAAFEYSLFKTKEIAEKGDCLPLKTGLKFMKLRSEGNNLQDPHVRALKRMVTEPLYLDYLKYVTEKCG